MRTKKITSALLALLVIFTFAGAAAGCRKYKDVAGTYTYGSQYDGDELKLTAAGRFTLRSLKDFGAGDPSKISGTFDVKTESGTISIIFSWSESSVGGKRDYSITGTVLKNGNIRAPFDGSPKTYTKK